MDDFRDDTRAPEVREAIGELRYFEGAIYTRSSMIDSDTARWHIGGRSYALCQVTRFRRLDCPNVAAAFEMCAYALAHEEFDRARHILESCREMITDDETRA